MRGNTDWTRKAGFWGAPWLLIAAALWVGAPAWISELPDDMNFSSANVIVEFAVPVASPEGEDAAPPEGPAEIAARILSRLGAQVRESARVFEFLPLIALEADAETMLRLIAMPEVLAIQPDRELEVLPAPLATDTLDAPGDITIPVVTEDIAVPDVSDALTMPEVPGETAADDPDPQPLEPDAESEPPAVDE